MALGKLSLLCLNAICVGAIGILILGLFMHRNGWRLPRRRIIRIYSLRNVNIWASGNPPAPQHDEQPPEENEFIYELFQEKREVHAEPESSPKQR